MDAFTENPYSFTTHDAPFNMRLFCGRTQDLQKIVGCLRRNESIALFGERRIGKTLLLYCLRDLINDTEPWQPPYELIDIKLSSQWNKLCKQLANCHAVFVTIQDLPDQEKASGTFQQLIQKACAESGLHARTKGKPSSLADLFKKLTAELEKRNERLVILVDEIEDLRRFKDSHQMLVNLRSIIETHAGRISFVFSGAEHWHQEVKYGSSPLANNLLQFYVRSPDPQDIKQFLIIRPLSQVLDVRTLGQLAQDIIELTGGKPWFIQMICYFLWQYREKVGVQGFDRLWGLFLRDAVDEQSSSHLRNAHNRADEYNRKVLKTLSVSEPLSAKQIGRILSIPAGEVFRILSDLEDLERVKSQHGLLGLGSKRFRFADKITREWWRERAGDVKSFPWTLILGKVAKWSIIVTLLGVAIFLYLYTHPPLKHHSVELPDYIVEVWYPASVEESEEGSIQVVGHNRGLSSASPLTVTIILNSISVNYKADESNIFAFAQIRPGEKRQAEFGYVVYPSVPSPEITTEVTLSSPGVSSGGPSAFTMVKRMLPIKRYLVPFQALIIALVGMTARREIGQFIEAVVSLASTAKPSEPEKAD